MPVWQGQGYNSGVRDATNLAEQAALATAQIDPDSRRENTPQSTEDTSHE